MDTFEFRCWIPNLTSRIYHISKFGLKYSILHFKMNKTIKFERIFFSLEPFLESLEDVHVNNYGIKNKPGFKDAILERELK